MRNPLFGVITYNRQEIFMLLLTSLQAFCIGAFVALFNIGAHVLFFQMWEPEMIPKAFFISGILGIVLFSLYAFFQNRSNSRVLTLTSLFILLVINVLVFLYFDNIATLSIVGIPLMLPFTLAIPVTFLTLVIFRKSIKVLYTPDQHRRLHPMIRTALIAGIVGASYGLVGTLYITWDVLLIIRGSAIFILLAVILQLPVILYKKHLSGNRRSYKRTSQLRSRFWEMFYSRYSLILTIFVVLSAIIGFVLHYHFIRETRISYPDTIGLSKFFGFFMGTMFLFTYSIERFLIRKILYSYDSPYSIVLIPVILVIASAGSLVVGLLVGQSTAVARFSFGFLMIAIVKIGYETTYETIELPSLRVLFRTLDIRFSNAIIPRLEGTFRMAALSIAGVIIWVLLALNLGKSLFLNIALLALTLAWVPVGIFLVKAYQNALRDTIRRLKTSKRDLEQDLLNTDEKSHHLINSDDPSKSINTLAIIERLEPLTHEKHLVSLLTTDSGELHKYLLERIEEHVLLSSLPVLKEISKSSHSGHNGSVSRLISRFENKLNAGSNFNALESLVDSVNLADRILAAEIIGNSDKRDYDELLLHLSRDIEPDVKRAAVKAIARIGNPHHSHVLIGYLTVPAYYPYAFEALVKIGDKAIPVMEQMFLLPDADNTVLLRIVRIYGKIGSPLAIDSLLAKIENQNRVVSRQAILALREAKFQATPANINRILNDIVRLINIMSWNFAAYESIRNHRHFSLLCNAIEAEIKENYQSLYHLLALAYNPTSIGNIKNLLTRGDDLDISLAIELLDQIVNEEIKQVFFPVVENISVSDRYKQLQYFFHATRENPENLIYEIITRDFNQVSLYLKSCAIISKLSFKKSQAGQETYACIFHPGKLLRETAGYVIHKTEPEQLNAVLSRIDKQLSSEIRTSLSNADKGAPYLLLDRIRFIKNCPKMKNVPEDVLIEVSNALEIHYLNKDEEFLIKREDVHYAFMIIIEGTAIINISSDKVLTFGKNDIIYSDIYIGTDQTFSLRADTNLTFYSLEQEMLNSLMFDFIDFRSSILEMVEEL